MVSRKRTSRFRVDTEAVKQPPWRPEPLSTQPKSRKAGAFNTAEHSTCGTCCANHAQTTLLCITLLTTHTSRIPHIVPTYYTVLHSDRTHDSHHTHMIELIDSLVKVACVASSSASLRWVWVPSKSSKMSHEEGKRQTRTRWKTRKHENMRWKPGWFWVNPVETGGIRADLIKLVWSPPQQSIASNDQLPRQPKLAVTWFEQTLCD